eukprot:7728136-Pyramimonas_sp.AAC.1
MTSDSARFSSTFTAQNSTLLRLAPGGSSGPGGGPDGPSTSVGSWPSKTSSTPSPWARGSPPPMPWASRASGSGTMP